MKKTILILYIVIFSINESYSQNFRHLILDSIGSTEFVNLKKKKEITNYKKRFPDLRSMAISHWKYSKFAEGQIVKNPISEKNVDNLERLNSFKNLMDVRLYCPQINDVLNNKIIKYFNKISTLKSVHLTVFNLEIKNTPSITANNVKFLSIKYPGGNPSITQFLLNFPNLEILILENRSALWKGNDMCYLHLNENNSSKLNTVIIGSSIDVPLYYVVFDKGCKNLETIILPSLNTSTTVFIDTLRNVKDLRLFEFGSNNMNQLNYFPNLEALQIKRFCKGDTFNFSNDFVYTKLNQLKKLRLGSNDALSHCNLESYSNNREKIIKRQIHFFSFIGKLGAINIEEMNIPFITLGMPVFNKLKLLNLYNSDNNSHLLNSLYISSLKKQSSIESITLRFNPEYDYSGVKYELPGSIRELNLFYNSNDSSDMTRGKLLLLITEHLKFIKNCSNLETVNYRFFGQTIDNQGFPEFRKAFNDLLQLLVENQIEVNISYGFEGIDFRASYDYDDFLAKP